MQVMTQKKISVLVIDDSALVRKIMIDQLSKFDDIEVIGTAPDPFIGRDKIVELKPDVLILDIEMPKMDGLQFLEILMKHQPMPVIVVSSLATEGGEVAMRAIDLGAAEVIAKPGSSYSVMDMTEQLAEKIRAVGSIRVSKRARQEIVPKAPPKKANSAMLKTTNRIITIGASTGGTEALREILEALPPDMAPIVITQHMPQFMTKAFADRLNTLCALEVREAKNGDHVLPGSVLIAPGNCHMELRRSGARYYVEITNGPLVHHQRPSVDVMFNSVAEYAGANAVGVILTGMGKDGANGLLKLRDAGAITVAQDEASSVVFGMPKEAIEIGAANKVLALKRIAGFLSQYRSSF